MPSCGDTVKIVAGASSDRSGLREAVTTTLSSCVGAGGRRMSPSASPVAGTTIESLDHIPNPTRDSAPTCLGAVEGHALGPRKKCGHGSGRQEPNDRGVDGVRGRGIDYATFHAHRLRLRRRARRDDDRDCDRLLCGSLHRGGRSAPRISMSCRPEGAGIVNANNRFDGQRRENGVLLRKNAP